VLRLEDVARLGDERYCVIDGWLGRPAALAVVAAAEEVAAAGRLRPAGMGAGARLEVAERGDRIAWLDTDAEGTGSLLLAMQELHGQFVALRDELNGEAYLGLDGLELQLALYPGGGARYARHRDALAGVSPPGRPPRRLTAIYYLNDGWEPSHGGQLRLYPPASPSAPRNVDPVLDRLLLFLSAEVEHEVLPAHRPRLAITAWFHGRC
jgi:SM-20-related protein